MRVVCAGHVNWDVTLRVDRIPEPDAEGTIHAQHEGGGGSAANAAVGLVGLGCEAVLVGSVGDDDHGRRARRDLADRGVDLDGLRTVPGAATALKYLLVDDDGEVAVLGTEGANEAVDPADLDPGLVAGADRLHLTGQRPETAARLAELAAGAGVPVSFDPGRRLADRDFGATLALADVVFLNRREAAVLDGRPNPDCVVVEKRGTDGARVDAPDAAHDHPGFALPCVDSTGAGDAFAAGFLAALARDGGLARALAVANACGALAARSEGARTDLSWAAVERVLAGEAE